MPAATMQNDPRWGEVLVEEAADAAGRARLARQAVALDRARHPGVAELLEHDDDGERATLVVRPHGRRTLADLAELAGDQVAAAGAAAAQTLADLHRGGVSHGSLRADRIHLTELGQPVLVGFADAGFADPPPGHSSNFDPGGDVEALADLLEQLLDPAEATHRRGGALLAVLHRAAGSSMEELAAALAELAGPVQPPLRQQGDPFAELGWLGDATREFWPSPGSGRPPVRRPTRRFSGSVVWLAVLALVALLAGAAVVVTLAGSGSATGAAGAASGENAGSTQPTGAAAPWVEASGTRSTDPAASTPADPTASAAATATAAATASAAAGPAPSVAVATSECPTSYEEAASVGIPASCASAASAHGNTVQVGPLSWIIGDDRDVAAVGDFDCDGWLEAVALAPASAQVVAFDGWAGAGQEPTGRVVRVVPAAAGLDVRQEGSCHHLLVTGPPAGPVEIDPTARPSASGSARS